MKRQNKYYITMNYRRNKVNTFAPFVVVVFPGTEKLGCASLRIECGRRRSKKGRNEEREKVASNARLPRVRIDQCGTVGLSGSQVKYSTLIRMEVSTGETIKINKERNFYLPLKYEK